MPLLVTMPDKKLIILIFAKTLTKMRSGKMPKIRLLLIILLPLAAVAGSIVVLLRPSSTSDPLKAIPESASMIIRVNNIHNFISQYPPENLIWNELKKSELINHIDRQVKILDSLYLEFPEVKAVLDMKPAYITAHFTGNDVAFMFFLTLPQSVSEKNADSFIRDRIINIGTITERKYENRLIREVRLLNGDSSMNFSYSVVDNLLMISFSSVIMEDALRQVAGGDNPLMSDTDFMNVFDTASKNASAGANIFLNLDGFARIFSVLINNDYKSEVRAFNYLSRWAELDVNILPEIMLLNGFMTPSGPAPLLSSLFVSQKPQQFKADEVLPATTSAFLSFSFSELNVYLSSYRDMLREQGKLTSRNNTLTSLRNTYNVDFSDVFTGITDNEITLAFDAGSSENHVPRAYIFFRLKSQAMAKEKLTEVIRNIAAAESKNVNAYISSFDFDNETHMEIYRIPVKKLVAKVFGDVFGSVDDHYFMFLDNYLVFSSSTDNLRSLASNYILKRTLNSDPVYTDFKNSVPLRSNICFFTRLDAVNRMFAEYLDPGLAKTWEKEKTIFEKVPYAGFQIYSDGGIVYSNVLLRYLEAGVSQAATFWECRLDTSVAGKPVFVTNHTNGEKEIFVQDAANNIYLINQAGRTIWKLPLNEKIMSDVYQIDYYSNGRLQLLFSTESHIYLLDRNGNAVGNYPVNLRSPATCGMALFDYDNNKTYRILIACSDRKVYAYDKEGKLVPGWTVVSTESEVTSPVKHFRVGNLDYIVFGDKMKTYILDRRGVERINPGTYFEKPPEASYSLELNGTNGPGVVTTDISGKIYFIHFNGKVSSVEIGTFSENHFFDYRDINGDGTNEFIFLDDNRLFVYNPDKALILQKNFNEKITERPSFYEFSSTDRKIGIVSRPDNLIYLLNNDGSVYEGFPLQGNTLFTIGYLGNTGRYFNLITGSRDNLLYNYQLK